MPQEPQNFSKIESPKMREFFLRATAYIRADQSQVAIKSTDPEFVAWGEYFERVVGALPVAYRMAGKDDQRAFTAPAQWPEWFEASYALPAPDLARAAEAAE